jgi:hypothetical protein
MIIEIGINIITIIKFYFKNIFFIIYIYIYIVDINIFIKLFNNISIY